MLLDCSLATVSAESKRIDATRSIQCFARQELPTSVPELQPTAVDQVCSSANKQEPPLPGAKLQPTAVAKFAAPATQELPLSSTDSTAHCSRSSLQLPGPSKSPFQELLQTLSFVWQIKPTIPSLLLYNQSLQLLPSFSSLLPTATPYTTFGNSDLTVTPQDYLLIQPRTVDCPYIYPSIPKCFLPWQLLLPTLSLALPLATGPLQPRSEP